MDLEVARADRHLHPVAVAARRRRAPARPPTRSRRRSAATRRSGGWARASSIRSGRRSRARAARAPAARAAARAGPRRRGRRAPARARAPCRRARRRSRPPARSPACVTPGAKSAYGRAAGARRPPRDALDLRLELGSTCSARPAPREQLDRPVVVGRAEAAGDDEQVVLEPLAEAPPRAPAGASPTIVIRAGSSPSESSGCARNGPLRSVRSPRTSSLPVTTMAARGASPQSDDATRSASR